MGKGKLEEDGGIVKGVALRGCTSDQKKAENESDKEKRRRVKKIHSFANGMGKLVAITVSIA